MSWNSTIEGSAEPLQRTSSRTFTKTSLPVRPSLTDTSAMVDVRSTASPTRTGARNSNWLAAPTGRGSGTGGREPPPLGGAVGADLARAVQGQEVEQVPQRRQSRSGLHRHLRVVQRRVELLHGRGADLVAQRLAATDPGVQVIQV